LVFIVLYCVVHTNLTKIIETITSEEEAKAAEWNEKERAFIQRRDHNLRRAVAANYRTTA